MLGAMPEARLTGDVHQLLAQLHDVLVDGQAHAGATDAADCALVPLPSATSAPAIGGGGACSWRAEATVGADASEAGAVAAVASAAQPGSGLPSTTGAMQLRACAHDEGQGDSAASAGNTPPHGRTRDTKQPGHDTRRRTLSPDGAGVLAGYAS